jgi:hypothetical protein
LIKLLVQLGWVDNSERAPEDLRTRIVKITVAGLRKINRAMRVIFRQRIHMKHFEDLFRDKPFGHVLVAIDDYFQTTAEVGRSFGDISNVEFDFGLEDDH